MQQLGSRLPWSLITTSDWSMHRLATPLTLSLSLFDIRPVIDMGTGDGNSLGLVAVVLA